MLFQIFEDILTMPQGGATFVLELGQNLIFFSENSKGIVCDALASSEYTCVSSLRLIYCVSGKKSKVKKANLYSALL